MRKILLIFFLLVLTACRSGSDGPEDRNVSIKTEGVLTPLSFEVLNGEDLGDFLVDSDPIKIRIYLRNNSLYRVTHLEIKMPSTEGFNIDFYPDDDGLNAYPGMGGTCEDIILPSVSCEIHLIYYPQTIGQHTQSIQLSYRNLVERVTKSKTLHSFVGEAASLIFESQTGLYSYGVRERTVRDSLVTSLKVINEGGLPARNLSVNLQNMQSSLPYTIMLNSCNSQTLIPGDSCEIEVSYTSKNYSATAPDGEVDMDYSGLLRINYKRSPIEGDEGVLSAQFQVRSLTTKGVLETIGSDSISFGSLVVGNYLTQSFSIENIGYRELILRKIYIVKDGDVFATCFQNNTPFLKCYPGHLSSSELTGLSALNLYSFPFRIEDRSKCLVQASQLSYGRDAQDNLTIPGITQVKEGHQCDFEVTFHPSLENTSPGNFNNLKFIFNYDNTWLDQVSLVNTDENGTPSLSIGQAEFLPVGNLEVAHFLVDNESLPFTDEHIGQHVNYLADMGRIALVLNGNLDFATQVRLSFASTGLSPVHIQELRDGEGEVINTMATYLNPVYQQLRLTSSCAAPILPGVNTCHFDAAITPVQGPNVNSYTFDDEQGRIKFFHLKYHDGANYYDDLTPRPLREMTIKLRASLVQKGHLAIMNSGGSSQFSLVGGNQNALTLTLRNIGTGGIPRILFDDNLALRLPTNNDRYAFIPDETSSCYPHLYLPGPPIGRPELGLPAAIDSSSDPMPAAVLPSDQECQLTINIRQRDTDHISMTSYETLPYHPNLNGLFEWMRHFEHDNISWERPNFNQQRTFCFYYYDGDGVPDLSEGYIPHIEGYGNLKRASGGLSGLEKGSYQVGVNFTAPSVLFPHSPSPVSSAVFYRPSFSLPMVAEDIWGGSLAAQLVDEAWHYRTHLNPITQEVELEGVATTARMTESYFNDNPGDIPNTGDFDYLLYLGAFPVDGDYPVSFSLRRRPNNGITILSGPFVSGDTDCLEHLSGPVISDSSVISNSSVNFMFSPRVADGSQCEIFFELEYDGRIDGESRHLRIKLVADIIPDGDYPEVDVSFAYHEGNYDDILDEFVLTGDPLIFEPLPVDQSISSEPNQNARILFQTVKGSKVFDQKTIRITNTSPNIMRDLNFFLKQNREATTTAPMYPDLFTILSNNCSGDLGLDDFCEIVVRQKSSENAPSLINLYAVFSYFTDHSPERYLNEHFFLQFQADDPAILTTPDLPLTIASSVELEGGGSLSNQIIYNMNLGSVTSWSSNSHLVADNYNDVIFLGEISLENNSTQRASLLRQWQNFVKDCSDGIHVLPSECSDQDPVFHDPEDYYTLLPIAEESEYLIYYNKNLKVYADYACLFGGDHFASLTSDSGFNLNDSCEVRLYLVIDENIVGKNLFNPNDAKNVHFLSYYNNNRFTYSDFKLNLAGFIEPPRSNFSLNPSYFNVSALSSGAASFSWTNTGPPNSDWGVKTGYRVTYSRLRNQVDRYDLTLADYVDLPHSQNSATLTELETLSYYYVRIYIRMEKNGVEFLSRDRNMSPLIFVVPNSQSFFSFKEMALIDIDEVTFSPVDFYEAKDACRAQTRLIFRNGGNVQLRKELMFYDIYNEYKNKRGHFPSVISWLLDADSASLDALLAPESPCTGTGCAYMLMDNGDLWKFFREAVVGHAFCFIEL